MHILCILCALASTSKNPHHPIATYMVLYSHGFLGLKRGMSGGPAWRSIPKTAIPTHQRFLGSWRCVWYVCESMCLCLA